MFADPQSLTVGSETIALGRVGMSLSEGNFRSADAEHTLSIAHTNGKRIRHVAKLSFASIVANPLVPDQNQAVSASAHLVVDGPRNGLTVADQVTLARALAEWATEANLLKLISGES